MSDLPLPEPVSEETIDIQHDTDPAQDHGTARRIPHLGHTVLFFALAFTCLMLAGLVFALAFHIRTVEDASSRPLANVLTQLTSYALTLVFAVPLFATIWGKGFLDGISWTWRAARLHWWKLTVLGIVCSILAQLADNLSKTPASTELTHLFQNPAAAWLLTIVGVPLIPVMEEVAFRGFLLPSLATAYDWFSLERTPAGLQRWEQTTDHTRNALIFGAVFSSIAFTLMHGSQLHWARGPLAVLLAVALVLAAVRIVTRSVAASALVHIAYDAFIFAEVIVATHGYRHLDQLK